jgi:hypothetical protein
MAQDDEPRRGLAASASLGVRGGIAVIDKSRPGVETGASLDLGWLHSPRARLVLDVDFLRAITTRQDLAGLRVSDPYVDLSANVGVRIMSSTPRAVAGYVGAGAGVHAMSTGITVRVVSERYNTNVFGMYGAIGLLAITSPDRRDLVQVELRATAAQNVPRISLEAGYTRLFRDIPGLKTRPRRR